MDQWTPKAVYQLIVSLAGLAVAVYLILQGQDLNSVLAFVALITQAGGNLAGLKGS